MTFQAPFRPRFGPLFGGAAAVTPFSPLNVAGLAAWWDFSDITTLYQDAARTTPVTADGDVIGGVADKSPNGRHLSQATTSLKALYKTGILNGKSASLFDGSDDAFALTSLTSTTSFSFFVVFRPTSQVDSYGTILTQANISGFWYRGSTIRKMSLYYSVDHINNNAFTDNTASIYSARVVSGSGTHYRNGVADGTMASVPSIGFTAIGNDANSDTYKGYIFDMLVYTGTVSEADFAAITAYLNSKWAVY